MTYILHISDLHFVNNAASHNSGEVLIREAAERTRTIPPGQKLLIVTGDFHNFSDPDYQNAEDFLRRLTEGMGLDPAQDVFVVPGNHDVGNDGLLKPLLEAGDPKWRNHKKAALQMLKNGDRDYLDERLQVFLPYCAMVQRLGIYDEALGKDYPARTHVRCWRGRLNVLHLNTALTADGKTKTDQTTDTAGAADPKTWEALYREELPAIAIGHNSFYDLQQTQRRDLAGSFALRNVSAYLCGDTHLTETDPERQMIRLESGHIQCPEIPNLTAARGIADGDDRYSDVGFCWQLWDEERDRVTVEFRKWTREQLARTQPNGEAGAYCMLHAARPAAEVRSPAAAPPEDPGAGPKAPGQSAAFPPELPLLPPFKIAFTFTGEYRERVVRPVCRELLKLGFTRDDLFFDDWHSELFTGVNADSVFKTIYHDASDCVVVLLSPNYREKLWTDHLEWPTVRALINEGRHRKICLLNVDHVDIATIDGLKPGRDVAKEVDGMNAPEIAEFIWKWYCRHILRRNPERSLSPQPEPTQPQPEAVLSLPREEPALLRFGRYPQTRGGEERPIEWRVLVREEDRCLLISRYALDCMPFQAAGFRGAWGDCDLRDWLNRDFLTAAFTRAEQARIQPVTVSKERTYPAKDRKADKLFLLSVTEAADGRLFSGDADRVCAFTAYAAAKRSKLAGAYQPDNLSCWWWLRSFGDRPDRAAFVSYLGTVDTGGRAVDRRELGLRPALWLRTKPEPLPKEKKAAEEAGSLKPRTGAVSPSAADFLRAGAQIVTLGRYPQDANGNLRPIEWRVLERTDGYCLLLTRFAIENMPYHHQLKPVSWETSSLREWLNGEFLDFAFTETEKALIQAVSIPKDEEAPFDSAERGALSRGVFVENARRSMEASRDGPGADRVFLLSRAEAEGLFFSDADRRCVPTDYTCKQGAATGFTDGGQSCRWWLRSPGRFMECADFVMDNGSVNEFGETITEPSVCVRPALWIRL